jgi:hypothetical protein
MRVPDVDREVFGETGDGVVADRTIGSIAEELVGPD